MEPIYDRIGLEYDARRRHEPRIGRRIRDALGGASRVADIGTGTGNYSPTDRFCVGVDPSAVMLKARPATAGPAIQASAERLPFDNRSFDAALGVLTVHHWTDLAAGLGEMQRIGKRQVLFIREPFRHPGDFWLLDYFPEILEVEAGRHYPTVEDIGRHLSITEVAPIGVPANCRDGFLGSYWDRPEAFLDERVRRCISIFDFISDEHQRRGLQELGADLESGRWQATHGSVLSGTELLLGHQLVIAGRVEG